TKELHPLFKEIEIINKEGLLKTKLKDEITQHTIYEQNITNVIRIQELLKSYNYSNSQQYIINKMISYLEEHKLLPAIFFSLSRKNVMLYSKLVEKHLNNDKLNNEVRNDALYIMKKLPNYQEYINLPE